MGGVRDEPHASEELLQLKAQVPAQTSDSEHATAAASRVVSDLSLAAFEAQVHPSACYCHVYAVSAHPFV